MPPSPQPPIAPPAPRVRMPRAQREEQILRIAEEVFAERGFQATTMEDIAERVGVTKPLIYEYFGSKEGLLSACITRARTQLRVATEAAWQEVGAEAPLEVVFRAGVRAFFEFIDEHANAFVLIQQEGAVASQASPLIESIREQQSAATMATFRKAPALAGVPDRLLEGYVEVIIGACERVAVWRTRRPGVSTQEATDIVVSTVWAGLDALLPG
ncbi:TetR/AcrR family transcriptional regulator [Phycicoccus sp. Soil803]|uniref:TetR/AcrR family transcriptional regulator n=1 Tax=Phycicoccus sp. Soil803 TaxID=1736415 RepID=UPI001F23B0B6|nr:TetR/AcrR family transcriptional regulator [Phycicoccus sp. Soil803]